MKKVGSLSRRGEERESQSQLAVTGKRKRVSVGIEDMAVRFTAQDSQLVAQNFFSFPT